MWKKQLRQRELGGYALFPQIMIPYRAATKLPVTVAL
tara:strand:- start:1226 stop:1336 length:111 start_codon:yes stop_codon:yes gene_type:complete